MNSPYGVRLWHINKDFNLSAMRQEVADMMDVLLGRKEPPVDLGVATLLEVAEAYHARACEMEMAIHQAETEGAVLKGTRLYKFRTTELRTFIDVAKRAIDVGSRRITIAQMEQQLREHV